MKVVILGSSGGDPGARQYVSSYLINDSIAIDAGCLGFHGSPDQQARVRHVFLTHSHSDHTTSLPIFIENVWTPSPECPCIYGSAETLGAIRRSIFNNEVWPDFVALSERMPPFLRLRVLEPEVSVDVEGLRVMPVCVDHTIPTYAYVVQDSSTAIIFGADSAPTTRLWEIARTIPVLKAVFLEASFPNRMKTVAEVSRHLTPDMFGREAAKIPAGVKVIAVHMKVRYRSETESELNGLGLPLLDIGQCEQEYMF
jgi:ribonuclease BN (tRNA processing enzyme)